MSTPDRAFLTEAGVRFRLREAIEPRHQLGCLAFALLGGLVGFVLIVVVLVGQALLGIDSPLLALVTYMPVVLALAFGAISTRTVLSTERLLVIEGRTAWLKRGSTVLWSGPISALVLEEGHPFWTLRHGAGATRVTNPPDDLRWLLATLADHARDDGSRADIPAMLRERAAAMRDARG